MRRAVAEAVNHTRGRSAFGAVLIDQPLMINVLADLALESEAATATAMRLARAYDEGDTLMRRFGTAVLKYWVCKRSIPMIAEALECHGGNGYVEEGPMPTILRDVGVNGIWEGSGNVMALDVLRAMAREPEGLPAFLAECELGRGGDARLDAHLDSLPQTLAGLAEDPQWQGRRIVEDLALAFQASLLVRVAPPAVADAFCAGRLGDSPRPGVRDAARAASTARRSRPRPPLGVPTHRVSTGRASVCALGASVALWGVARDRSGGCAVRVRPLRDGPACVDPAVDAGPDLGRLLPVHQARPRGSRAGVPRLRPAWRSARRCCVALAAQRARWRRCAAGRARCSCSRRSRSRSRSSCSPTARTASPRGLTGILVAASPIFTAMLVTMGVGQEARIAPWALGRHRRRDRRASALLFGVDLTGSGSEAIGGADGAGHRARLLARRAVPAADAARRPAARRRGRRR